MSHSPAHVLWTYLLSQGVFDDPEGTDPAFPLYVGFFPDSPDAAACIMDVEGVKGPRLMSGPNNEHPGVQLLIRTGPGATAREVGYDKAKEANDLFQATHRVNLTIGGIDYAIMNLSETSPILALGQEPGSKRRWLHSMNYLCTIDAAEVVPGISIPESAMNIDHPTDGSATSSQLEGQIHTNKGAGSSTVRLSLPLGTANKHARFGQVDAGIFIVDPHASDHFKTSGGTLAAGQALVMSSAYSGFYIYYSGDNEWVVTDQDGSVNGE